MKKRYLLEVNYNELLFLQQEMLYLKNYNENVKENLPVESEFNNRLRRANQSNVIVKSLIKKIEKEARKGDISKKDIVVLRLRKNEIKILYLELFCRDRDFEWNLLFSNFSDYDPAFIKADEIKKLGAINIGLLSNIEEILSIN